MLAGFAIGGDRFVRIQKILWVVFLGSVPFYLAAAYLAATFRAGDEAAPAAPAVLRLAPIALAGAIWIAAFWIRRWLLVRAFGQTPIGWPAVQAVFVAGWGIHEAIALFGLVLVLLGGPPVEAAILCAAAFAGILLMPPAPGWLLDRLDAEAGREGGEDLS